jgi:hypothetical protein
LISNPAICLATAEGAYYKPGVKIADYIDGDQWAMGHPYWGLFTTILPPNSPTCYSVNSNNPSAGNGIFSPTSYHPGGVLAGMADASVRFIMEGIDCGAYGMAPSGTFGVWGAMGTCAGSEGMGLGGTP